MMIGVRGIGVVVEKGEDQVEEAGGEALNMI
jgi:hypothetical protein